MLYVLCCENRQQSAGTRRVHQLGHARARADTTDTPLTLVCSKNVTADDRACTPIPPQNGKEGVDGSSPSEGSAKFLLISPFRLPVGVENSDSLQFRPDR